MPYTVAAVGPGLEEAHIQKISQTAQALGCPFRFYENTAAALAELADVEILFAPGGDQGAALAAAAPSLKWFASFYAGVDALTELPGDVLLTNGSGAYGITIAEHLIMVLLMLLRRYPEYREFVENKVWRSDLMIGSLYGATAVVCGTGDIGTEFAKRLRSFAPAKIIGISRTGRENPAFDAVLPMERIDEVLPQADILALMLPGTPGTNDLFGQERLMKLKPGAVLANVGRGNCLDQGAVLRLLESGHLAGAALDVFRTEPIPQDDPVWNTPGLLVTPHCSGKMTMAYTRDTLTDTFCRNLPRFCAGQTLEHLVNRELGY